MAKKEEKVGKEVKKKPIFEKVGLVFRSPVRADILRQLSESPQRPIDIAENLDLDRQNINYHLNALKRGGMVQTRRKEFDEDERLTGTGTRINGRTKSGKLKVAQGVELTKNGKDLVNQFISPLFEENISEKNERIKEKNKKKEDEEG